METYNSTENANRNINKILEDSIVLAKPSEKRNTEFANRKINEEFNKANVDNDIPPTYLKNNTPAIKINEEQ